MSNERMATTAVLVIGVALLLGSLFADRIGLGEEPGYGYQQLLGIGLGVLLTGLGAYLRRRRSALAG
jgi:hypothetical protein